MRLLKDLGQQLKDVASFAWDNKRWWMIPIILLVLLVLGAYIHAELTLT